MRWPILAALLLCACAQLDASDRERDRRAWHVCIRDQMAHGWRNCQ